MYKDPKKQNSNQPDSNNSELPLNITQPISIPIGQERRLPNGSIIQADGTIKFFNGVSIRLNKEGGGQIVLPDGSELQPGERVVLPDGAIVEQE